MFTSLKVDRSKAVSAQAPIFVGEVSRQDLKGSDDLEISAVFFDNGARTRPHTHDTDQVLTVVEGLCVVADATERKHLGPGEIALVTKGEWHWHGAAKGHSGCHITIRKGPSPTSLDVEERDWADY
jgi:quercetin dioxygenase-like cupin family protein